jgi:LPS sulfotransferase NodH
MLAGLSGFSAARYDMAGNCALTQSYVIAASFRSGSTHLCTCLWKTGRLGAPFEYFNYEHEMKFMYERLRASSPEDYLEKLLVNRISRNGVFGVKAHFPHFLEALRFIPTLLERLAPVQFIYLRRRNQVAQAVSLAKAYQTRAWLSVRSSPERRVPLFYSGAFIQACLQEVASQNDAWTQWFQRNGIAPYRVWYEDLIQREAEVTTAICALLGVQGDAPFAARVPRTEQQSDDINADWIDRFTSSRGD